MGAAKTVLVTGPTGFIGRSAVRALADGGWKVIKGVRLASNTLAEGCIHLDFAEPEAILALSSQMRFDAIVHLGAKVVLADVPESELFVQNVLSTGCLAYLARVWSSPLVFASTAIVYGARRDAIQVDSPLCLDTSYAKSKWLAEQLIVASGARHCILRIAGVFGYNGPAHLGMNRAIDAAVNGTSPVVIGSGRALRNYIYVKDVAAAIVHALREGVEGTHLLAGHEVLSIGEMMRTLCEVFVAGAVPLIKDGLEATSQVIAPSPYFPATRSFQAALLDLREEVCR